jgi:hypothetical protein
MLTMLANNTIPSSFWEDIPKVGVVGGLLIVWIVYIVFVEIRKIATNKQTEQTRREIAAYVAEGSISPQDAERILKARMPIDD